MVDCIKIGRRHEIVKKLVYVVEYDKMMVNVYYMYRLSTGKRVPLLD